MVAVARHLTELRQQTRQKYWGKFLTRVRSTSSLSGIWQHVNRIRGQVRRIASVPDPASTAQDLLRTWTNASALAGLPDTHRDDLARHRPHRLTSLQHNTSLLDDTCVPITLDELLCAVKHGQSTAPGQDGLTYDILNALLVLQDNPILDIFNVIYSWMFAPFMEDCSNCSHPEE